MDKNLKKLIPFAFQYKKDIVLNIVYNIFYAFFSTILMVSMIPTLNVLFGLNQKITEKPLYTGIENIKSFSENYLNYKVTELTENSGFQYAMVFVISIIIVTAFLKNFTNYLASFQIGRASCRERVLQ